MKGKVIISFMLVCWAAVAAATDTALAEDFQRAERYYASKDYGSALRLYRDVLERDPGGPFAAACGLRVGMCDFALGEYAAAALAFQKFEEGFPTSPYLDDATFLAAQAYFRMGENHRSLERLLRVVSFGKKSRYYKRAVRGIGNLADEALTAEQLRKRLEDYHQSPEAAEVLFKLAQHEVKRRAYDKAVVLLDVVAGQYAELDAGREAEKLLASVREKLGREPLAVGVLLPLSGEYEVYGKEMRAAVELAAAEYNRARPDEPVTFVFEDSAGTEDGTLEGARRLIYGERVIAIVGPALTSDVRALASLCHACQVPLISPGATDGGVARINGYIFANGLTREVETATMAEYAVGHLGLKRFAVLHPANQYGADLRDAFTAAVGRAGGEVVGSVEYPLIDLNLGRGKREINYFPYTKKLKSLRADAIYLPGHYEEIIRLLPQLTFADVSAYVLGANGWNENRVVHMGGKYVEGAYFTAGFYADSPDAAVRAFVSSYRLQTAGGPDYLAAASYDAANIICSVLYPPAENGAEIKARLDAVADYPGVTGRTTLRGADGLLHKEVAILTVQEGEVVEAPR